MWLHVIVNWLFINFTTGLLRINNGMCSSVAVVEDGWMVDKDVMLVQLQSQNKQEVGLEGSSQGNIQLLW